MQETKVLSPRPMPNPSAQSSKATLGSAWAKVLRVQDSRETKLLEWYLVCNECHSERYVVKYDRNTWKLACDCGKQSAR